MNTATRTIAIPGTLLLVACLVGFGQPVHATEYTYGNWKCRNFEQVEEQYEEVMAESQTPERHDTQRGYGVVGGLGWSASFAQLVYDSQVRYAICLVLRGKNFDPGLLEGTGFRLLDTMANPLVASARAVHASFFIAESIRSGGNLDSSIDPSSAVDAYSQVLALINFHGGYPDWDEPYNHSAVERRWQMELHSWYYIPRLTMEKFYLGFVGRENWYLLSSPSYTGGRDLEIYEKYYRYTQGNLEKAVEHAGDCLNLRNKEHFVGQSYTDIRAACQIMKDTAQLLLPLDWEAHVLLNDDSCTDDLPQCQAYAELSRKVFGIWDAMIDELNAIDSVGRAYVRYAEDIGGSGQAGGGTAAAALTPMCDDEPSEGKFCWSELAGNIGCYWWAASGGDVSVSWSGQCSGGVANGRGELGFEDGKATGEIRDGKLQGRWVWSLDDGTVGEGFYKDSRWLCDGKAEGADCWQELANKPGCYIRTEHTPGKTFSWSGQCSGGAIVGNGKLVVRYTDGTIVETSYDDRRKFVKTRYTDGTYLEESYKYIKNDDDEWWWEMHGKQVARYSNGDFIEETWQDGKRHGKYVSSIDGDSYEGSYKDGKWHGWWIFRRPDGDCERREYSYDEVVRSLDC